MTSQQAWTPALEEASDTVGEGAALALHGLLDARDPAPLAGDQLPPLWHWMGFVPRVPQREIGEDGHPKRGSFMPPISLPRRMFAGARLVFGGPALVGDALHRHSTVVSVEEKTGRSGELVFVKVRHELSANGQLSLTEEQDIVYRSSSSGETRRPHDRAGPSPDDDWTWAWDLGIDPTVLFRFSALTYNAHRIHYDRPYATDVEGYPGLVVHGPLQAIALAELCRRHVARPLKTFWFRSVGPVFDDGPLRLRGRLVDEAGRVELSAFDADGRLSMAAEAGL